MPTYNFYNTETRQSFSSEMKISELEIYLKENPHLQQTLKPIPTVDPYSVGRYRTDSAFRDKTRKIKEMQPNSVIRTDNLTEI